MTLLKTRAWEIQVAPATGGEAKSYTGFRCTFQSKFGGDPSSQQCTVAVFMPPDAMIGLLGVKGATVRVLAGYQDGGAQILGYGTVVKGSVLDARGTRDPRVEFQLNQKSKLAPVIGVSLGGSVFSSEAFEAIATELGVQVEVLELADDVLMPRGYVATGLPRRHLQELAAQCGCQWDLRDGRLRVWPKGVPAIAVSDVWSARTGLTGIAGPNGDGEVMATALLRPSIRPGSLVTIDDPVHRGDLVVKEATHQGDTHGTNWYTTITGVPRAA